MSIARENGPLKWNLNSILAVSGASITVVAQIVTFTVLWTNNSRDVLDLNNKVTDINHRLDSQENDRKDRLKDYTKTLTDMQAQIATIVPMSYRVDQALSQAAENKAANAATNTRIDKVVESVGAKLDNVLDSVNKLSANVAVIGSKLEDTAKAQKSNFQNVPFHP
jgi:chromosome segregation ATPase